MFKKVIQTKIKSMSLEEIVRLRNDIPEQVEISNANLTYDMTFFGTTIPSNGTVIKKKAAKVPFERKKPKAASIPVVKRQNKKKKGHKKVKASPQRLHGEYSTRIADIMTVRRMLNKFDTLGCLTPLMKDQLQRLRRVHTHTMSMEDRKSLLRIFYNSRQAYIDKGGDEALKQHYLSKKKQLQLSL